MTNAHSHRSDLKQKNKTHKGEKKSHKSKELATVKTKAKNRILNKKESRLRAKQLRQNKSKIAKEFLKNSSTNEFVQVSIIPLCETIDPHLGATLLLKTDPNIKSYNIFNSRSNTSYVQFERFKKNVVLNIIEYGNIFQTIDLVNASDCILFLVPSVIDELISGKTEKILKAIFSIGLPPYMFVALSNMCDAKGLRNYLESLYIVPDHKVWCLNNPSDASLFLRQLCEKNLVRVPPRAQSSAGAGMCAFVQNSGKFRSLVKAEHVSVEKKGEEHFIKVAGIVRRSPLLLDESLRAIMQVDGSGPYLHIPGYGDFQLASATWTTDPASSLKHSFAFVDEKIQANGHVKEFSQLNWTRNVEWDENEKESAREHELEAINADEQNTSFEDSETESEEDDSTSEIDEEEKMEEDGSEDDISVHSIDSEENNAALRKLWKKRGGMRKRTNDIMSMSDDVTGDDNFSSYSWEGKSAKTASSTGKSTLSQAQLLKFRESRTESQFPDEVETPFDIPAKDRFSKFRGLDRFRTSEWPVDQDPTLPIEFAKSFQFPNYLRDRKSVFKFMIQRLKSVANGSQSPQTYIPCGSLTSLTLGPMDEVTAKSIQNHIHGEKQNHIFCWSLLPHERRFSVAHFSMKRSANAARIAPHIDSVAKRASDIYTRYSENEDLSMEIGEEANWANQKTNEFLEENIHSNQKEYKCNPDDILESEPIRSKEPMVFQVGIRRFLSCPIYSEALAKVNVKARYERFFNISLTTPTIASVYSPVVYAPQNVLQFRVRTDEDEYGNVGEPYIGEMVATGSVYSVDPKRLIIKRILLSGHPYKINKRSAVVRFMFFNPDDVNFFKPVQLQTKWGAIGHIKQSVGTHGLMKCVFDRQLTSADVVLMPLYKRVLPKPSYLATILPSLLSEESVEAGGVGEKSNLPKEIAHNLKSCMKKLENPCNKKNSVQIIEEQDKMMEIFD